MNGARSQTKCSDVVRQSLAAAPSDVSGSHCSVLLDKAPPCRPQSQSNGVAFTEGLGFWGRDVNSLRSGPNACKRSSQKAHLFIYFFIFCLYDSVWIVAFSDMRLFIAARFLCSSLSRIPALLLDFLHSLSVTLLSLLIYFFHPRLCCPLCFKHLFVWLPPPSAPSSSSSPAFLSPPTLKCFSSACLASNPPQSLLSFIHENADPQQGREKRQQT